MQEKRYDSGCKPCFFQLACMRTKEKMLSKARGICTQTTRHCDRDKKNKVKTVGDLAWKKCDHKT